MADVDILSDDDAEKVEPLLVQVGAASAVAPLQEDPLVDRASPLAASIADILSDSDDNAAADAVASAPLDVSAALPPAMSVAAVACATEEQSLLVQFGAASAAAPLQEDPSVARASVLAASIPDILSDSDDDAAADALASAPSDVSTALPPAMSVVEVAPTEEACAAVAEQPKRGLRSVVVARVELDNSEEEGLAPLPSATKTADATEGKDSEDEDLADLASKGDAQVAAPALAPPPAKRTKTGEDAGAVAPGAKSAAAPQLEPGKLKAAAAKAEAPVKKLTKDMAEIRVLEYMRQQNRPYNAQNVFDNLHGAVPKVQVQAALDSGAAAGSLVMKEYSKSKVYLVAQIAASSEHIEQEANALKEEVCAAQRLHQEAKAKVDAAKKTSSTSRNRRRLLQGIEEAKKESLELEARLVSLREEAEAAAVAQGGGGGDISCGIDEKEIEIVEEALRTAVNHWKKRKRLCMEVVKTFSEGAEMKIAKIIDKYNIEMDEACDQMMPDFAAG